MPAVSKVQRSGRLTGQDKKDIYEDLPNNCDNKVRLNYDLNRIEHYRDAATGKFISKQRAYELMVD